MKWFYNSETPLLVWLTISLAAKVAPVQHEYKTTPRQRNPLDSIMKLTGEKWCHRQPGQSHVADIDSIMLTLRQSTTLEKHDDLRAADWLIAQGNSSNVSPGSGESAAIDTMRVLRGEGILSEPM